MSTKVELKNALDGLRVNLPLRLTSSVPKFTAPTPPREISHPLLEAHNESSVTTSKPAAPQVTTDPLSINTEESLSKMDRVQPSQCQDLTVFKTDNVQPEQCPKRTVSKMNLLDGKPEQLPARFTAVPQVLLRGSGQFSEPVDFMIYLHLYTYSYGFGRDTAFMSQKQIEAFTLASKNTIKRSLDRLVAQGWIKCVEDYEHSRMSRKWRVRVPSGAMVSNMDTVQSEQCAELTQGVSKSDTVTVSKIDPFLEINLKEKSKNSLSDLPEALQKYFSELKPAKKREGEWREFLNLQQDYEPEQIAVCVDYLSVRGTAPEGEPFRSCHSPMAFLSKAIPQVLGEASAWKAKMAARSVREHSEFLAAEKRRAENEFAERDAKERETAFLKAFSSPLEQLQAIREHLPTLPGIKLDGSIARSLAVAAWWKAR